MATPSKPTKTMAYYDIAMRQPIEKNCCSPNPWKGRLALNFKNIDYSTTWVQMPDISKVRRELGLGACRKFADGTEFYTLPILIDPNTDSKIGDSFDIAVHLQNNYPDAGSGNLFPPQQLDFVYEHTPLVPLSEQRVGQYDEYARFNTNVDAAFTAHILLWVHRMPFDPATADACKAIFLQRSGAKSWDDFEAKGELRVTLKESLCAMLGNLSKLFLKDTSGPYLLGETPSYADLTVGAWLRMMATLLPEEEWAEVRSWHEGVFGRLYDALEKYSEVK
ncbi:hypothetical protein BGW41_006552 [Actinomortierella wolfii]|nr:hypothetical protein BGW41_006552 [Actinomortierella wolfii]